MYFRKNPSFDTYKTLLNLGSGTVLISLIEKSGVPSVVEKAHILPTQSEGGQISYAERDKCIRNSTIYSKYSHVHDFESAYEFLKRRELEELQQKIERKMLKEAAYAEAEKEVIEQVNAARIIAQEGTTPTIKNKKSSRGFFRNLFKK
jgi:hypothetical protein